MKKGFFKKNKEETGSRGSNLSQENSVDGQSQSSRQMTPKSKKGMEEKEQNKVSSTRNTEKKKLELNKELDDGPALPTAKSLKTDIKNQKLTIPDGQNNQLRIQTGNLMGSEASSIYDSRVNTPNVIDKSASQVTPAKL